MSAITVTRSVLNGYTPAGSYWQLGQGVLGPHGQLVAAPNGPAINNIPLGYLPASCASASRGVTGLAPSCRDALAGFRAFVTYQPGDRYWAFQGIETGIFVLLAVVLLTVTAVVLLRRDA
jgi:hypothetical protein